MKTKPPKPRTLWRAFLAHEAASGLMLIGAALVALALANSPWRDAYHALLAASTGIRLDAAHGPLNVHALINDAAMALFFLVVGLEIKREFTDGALKRPADRRLPIFAASTGMLVPAVLYLAIAGTTPGLSRGWAIPAATDIAFAIGVLALLGSRAPPAIKVLLTAIAIIDDMGAVAIIALAYTPAIKGAALLGALLILGAMYAANRMRVAQLRWYMLGFGLLWYAIFVSGVHATVAGVLAALTIPGQASAAGAEDAPLHRLEHALHRPVAWLIVPLFGFANAGVSFGDVSPWSTLPVAIALGLFLGKQLGIGTSLWVAIRFGWAPHPAGVRWWHLYAMALLCGIGFTMSLFIGNLAFADPQHADAVRVGVLGGSLLSAISGWAVLRFAPRGDRHHH